MQHSAIVDLPRSQNIEVEVLETLDAVRAAEPDWRVFLANGVHGGSIYNDPVYIQSRLDNEPRISPWVIVLRRNGQIRCVAPFFLEHTRRKIQFSVATLANLALRMLNLFGAEIVVATDEDKSACYAAVFAALSKRASMYDAMLFEHVDVSAAFYEYCARTFSGGKQFRLLPASSRTDTVYQIRLAADYDEYQADRSPKTRQKLRRFVRKLRLEHDARLEHFSTPEQAPRFLHELDQVYRDTWQARFYGYRCRNGDDDERFLVTLAEHGWLRCYTLAGKQGPLAYVVGFQYDGVFYYDETGFSPALAELSPGFVLTHLLIEDLFRSNSPALVDFRHGKHAYKRSFSNAEQTVASIYVVPPNRWRKILAIQRALFAAEDKLRSVITSLKLDRLLRRLLKRAGADVGRYG
jgi:CelD/BcsL family acetyltransferase involved in cellulose biosynthesis